MKKIAIIGAGGIANGVHLPSLTEIPTCRIVAICDIVREKAEKAAQEYGIPKVYTLYSQMLEAEEIDAVYALVEPDRMYRVVYDCLKAGKHVFMEKPAGVNSHQAHSLVRAAEAAGKLVAVGLNRRHIPLIKLVMEKMRAITQIVQIDGTFMKNTDISEAWHYTSAYVCDIIHATDLVRYLARSEPCSAATVIARNNSPVDNAWNSVIRFENGIVGTVRGNYQAGGRIHNFEIHGPGASAFIDIGLGGMSCEARILNYQGKSMYSMASGGVMPPQIETIDGKALAGDQFHQFYGYLQEDQEFIRCLETGDTPTCSIEDAAKTMEMVELLLASEI